MSFTNNEITDHMKVIEELFWSRRRPPVHMRDQVREGQRFRDRSIELFIARPLFNRPGEQVEESIVKLRHLPGLGVWRIFWKRADRKWHRYEPFPEAASLSDALAVVDQDANCCFFG